MADEIKFRYFRSVEGSVVPRWGTPSFIGVRRVPSKGWEWNTEKVVSVPEYETIKYLREYNRALKDGSIIEVSKPAAAKEAVVEVDIPEPETEEPADEETKRTKRGGKGSRKKKEND
jgi:hypothetical protein